MSDKYINLKECYDRGTLIDWYIHSVGNEPPVWTEAHIDELLKDFYIVPKELNSNILSLDKKSKTQVHYCPICQEPHTDGDEICDYCYMQGWYEQNDRCYKNHYTGEIKSIERHWSLF